MTKYMGYQIRSTYNPIMGRSCYDIYAENHWQDGRVTWERTAGGYTTLNAAKAACRAHFGRL